MKQKPATNKSVNCCICLLIYVPNGCFVIFVDVSIECHTSLNNALISIFVKYFVFLYRAKNNVWLILMNIKEKKNKILDIPRKQIGVRNEVHLELFNKFASQSICLLDYRISITNILSFLLQFFFFNSLCRTTFHRFKLSFNRWPIANIR